MASPLTIGTSAVTVVPIRKKRDNVRMQNTGATVIYIKKIPLEGPFSIVSPTDYDVLLTSSTTTAEAGDAFETDSISSFMAVSSAAGGLLAIYETIKA